MRRLPDDPRISGGLPTVLITGYSDLGRQATNPQWQYPTVLNPNVNDTWTRGGAHSFKIRYELQWINTEVQDVNPLCGRDTAGIKTLRASGRLAFRSHDPLLMWPIIMPLEKTPRSGRLSEVA